VSGATLADEALALAFRAGLPFAGLRDHEHDPELDEVIPPDAARTARVLPLAADAQRVRLAVADAEPDLTALAAHLADRHVELTIAPREELDAILGPPPPPPVVAPPPPAPVAEPAPEQPDPAPEQPDPAPEPPTPDPAPPAPEPPAFAPVAAAVHPEPAEVPSWLEPRRRWSGVLRILLYLLLALIAAAAVIGAVLAAPSV
jgi:type II secretion system (T2SS) protein E